MLIDLNDSEINLLIAIISNVNVSPSAPDAVTIITLAKSVLTKLTTESKVTEIPKSI